MKELDVGEVIGNKYVLVRLLGVGAMGQWAARHQALQQTFAIKLMLPRQALGFGGPGARGVETSRKRFENEAQIAAALSRKSRHIGVGVSDYGIDDEVAYLVMGAARGRRARQAHRRRPKAADPPPR